ncbi:MAG: hypothetical protein B7X43_01865 [Thiomonas sp. 15-63-373]|jgi:hypothetical protein|nr:MAG: hypothetical protein B7X43_01865 [Thiomonas sp. 15-63-373]
MTEKEPEKKSLEVPTSPVLREYLNTYQKAKTELDLATKLVAELGDRQPVPKALALSGYCASAHLTLPALGSDVPLPARKAQFAQYLKSYPPVALVHLPEVVASKPVKALREDDLRLTRLPIYPIVIQDNRSLGYSARWWTLIGGDLAEVSAPGVSSDCLEFNRDHYTKRNSHRATSSQSVYLRNLQQFPNKFDLTKMAPELAAAYARWDALERTLRSPGAKKWSAGLRASLKHTSLPSMTDLLDPEHRMNRYYKGPQLLTEDEMSEVCAVAGEVDSAERKEIPLLTARMREMLERGQELLVNILREFHASTGSRSSIRETVIGSFLADALQQKLDREVGNGVQLAFLGEEFEMFVVRLRVLCDAVEGGIMFLDFKVKTDAGKPRLTLEALQPEYAAE